MKQERDRFTECTCPICGKSFGVMDTEAYVYKKQTRKGEHRWTYFCSWHCFRKWERDHEERMKTHDGRKTRWKTKEERDRLNEKRKGGTE